MPNVTDILISRLAAAPVDILLAELRSAMARGFDDYSKAVARALVRRGELVQSERRLRKQLKLRRAA